MGLPWWVWVMLVVAAALLLFVLAGKSWRARIRREFVEFLAQEAPDLEVTGVSGAVLRIRGASGVEGRLDLDRLYREGAQLKPDDEDGRRRLYVVLLAAIRSGESADKLDPTSDPERLRLRIVPAQFVAELEEHTDGHAVPHTAIGPPALAAVLVLDSDASVMYVTSEHLEALGLEAEAAFEQAAENLARTFDPQIVRGALEDRSVALVKAGDTYDAARLYIVPRFLREGERLAAVIPDRDTLALAPVPDDGDWAGLRKLARTRDGDPLYGHPLVVTRAGVEAAAQS